uniref:Uncharacterized protein n=1 Tax=Equus asinus asinus TaxID=83772 RepID=A0A8C4LSS8_EQUAS
FPALQWGSQPDAFQLTCPLSVSGFDPPNLLLPPSNSKSVGSCHICGIPATWASAGCSSDTGPGRSFMLTPRAPPPPSSPLNSKARVGQWSLPRLPLQPLGAGWGILPQALIPVLPPAPSPP